jgi:beta-galactosidase
VELVMRDILPALWRSTAALSLLTASAMAAAPSLAAAPAVAADPRTVTDLSAGWRFRFGGDAAGVTAGGYDDSGWQQVALPHSWNRLGDYRLTRQGSTGRNADMGTGWYRSNFAAPRLAAGRRLYLQFDGVGAVARVWINGVEIGGHAGAFSRFRFDITDKVKPGAANLIVVSADNSKPKPSSPTEAVLPLAGDFFIYGGIYRGVSLVEADAAQIDLLDHGGPGVYARTVGATDAAAEIAVRSRLRNVGAKPRKLSLVTTIVDAAGNSVATATAPAVIAAQGTSEVEQALSVANPHLWNGTADPYQYRVVAELRDGARTIDRVDQPLGIRTFRIDPNEGFFLNGKHLALHGVSRHQDLMGKGWAMTPADQAADMAIVKEIGANTIRLAHYQHDQAWVSEADKAGMVTWAEIPFVTAANLEGKAPTAALVANAEQQLVELVRQNYNHPSVAMWSVGNEVDAGELFLPGKLPQQSAGLLKDLAALAKREDPSRPTTFADCCEDSPAFEVHGPQLAGTTDLIGYNRYNGWYYGGMHDIGPTLDALHAKHPSLPMSVSEYGAGGGVSQHSDDPRGGQVAIIGRPHPEEYQSWYHEANWQQLAARKYLFATWVWSLFDFASEMRGEGDSVDMNDKGLVTFDRKVKKDAFYFYAASWSADPVLHLNGRRYVDRAYPATDVRAYSNADKVSLTVNGAAIGTVACPDRVCVWKDVRLKPGANSVEARATIGGKAVVDQLNWTAPDAAQGMHIKAGELNGRKSGGLLYGSDAFFTGGTPTQLNALMLRPGASAPVKKVTGEGDLDLHRAFRAGAFSYDLPLPDGGWTVTIHTLEPDPALAATRSFDVVANGKTVLPAFSPAKAGGGALVAVAKSFTAKAVDGHLKLDFIPRGGPAILSAIDISQAR